MILMISNLCFLNNLFWTKHICSYFDINALKIKLFIYRVYYICILFIIRFVYLLIGWIIIGLLYQLYTFCQLFIVYFLSDNCRNFICNFWSNSAQAILDKLKFYKILMNLYLSGWIIFYFIEFTYLLQKLCLIVYWMKY